MSLIVLIAVYLYIEQAVLWCCLDDTDCIFMVVVSGEDTVIILNFTEYSMHCAYERLVNDE